VTAGTGPPGMDSRKPRPNHRRYLAILRGMSPEARLRKAFELSDLSRELFRHGLKRRFTEKSEAELREIEMRRLDRWRSPTS
jgi:hypothetical protein